MTDTQHDLPLPHCVTRAHHSRDVHNQACRGPEHHLFCKLRECEWKTATAQAAAERGAPGQS